MQDKIKASLIYTSFEESKKIGKRENSDYYWISDGQIFQMFCTKKELNEQYKFHPHIVEIYSAYLK